MERQIFHDKEENSFDKHIPNVDLFANYGAIPQSIHVLIQFLLGLL